MTMLKLNNGRGTIHLVETPTTVQTFVNTGWVLGLLRIDDRNRQFLGPHPESDKEKYAEYHHKKSEGGVGDGDRSRKGNVIDSKEARESNVDIKHKAEGKSIILPEDPCEICASRLLPCL